jgi:hypothetical protein
MSGGAMSILSDITSVAVGPIWKVAAIGLLAGMVTSSAYLGYQWHSAAGERDMAVSERSKAEVKLEKANKDNGELAAHIFTQNKSILDLAEKSATAQANTATALAAFAPIKKGIADLAARISALAPSVTCEQALAKQRKAIDGLRGEK